MKRAKDQKVGDMGFAGMNNTQVSGSSTKYAHNQWSGHSNDGRSVQMPQQPNTRGNDGRCHDPKTGGSTKGRTPPTAALPASVKIKDPDYINGGAPVRGSSMTRPKTGRESFNMGRGPTKGNKQ